MRRRLATSSTRSKRSRRFLEDGGLSLDNTIVERQLRRVATGRKNYLFCRSDPGAQRAAIIYSLVASCALVGVAPRAYIAWVLEQLETTWVPDVADRRALAVDLREDVPRLGTALTLMDASPYAGRWRIVESP